MDKKPQKKPMPMDERVVKALAALLDGATPQNFDQMLQVMVEELKPRILSEWTQRQARKNLSKLVRPIENAMAQADGDAEVIAKAIIADPEAVKIIQQLGK